MSSFNFFLFVVNFVLVLILTLTSGAAVSIRELGKASVFDLLAVKEMLVEWEAAEDCGGERRQASDYPG